MDLPVWNPRHVNIRFREVAPRIVSDGGSSEHGNSVLGRVEGVTSSSSWKADEKSRGIIGAVQRPSSRVLEADGWWLASSEPFRVTIDLRQQHDALTTPYLDATMIAATRRWFRRNRTNLVIGAGVIGAGYVAGQYVLGKISEARQRMSEDRIAKEK